MPQTKHNEDVLHKQVRGSAVMLSGRVLAIALNLFVQIFIVRYLAKNEYGAFAYAIAMVALGTNISLLGLDKSLARFMAIYHEANDLRRTAGTVILILLTVIGCGLAIIVGVIGLQAFLREHFISDPLSLTLLVTMIALAPIDGLDAIFQSIFGVFGEVRSVFFRRYVLGPLLKLMAIIGVMIFQGNVQTLAICYLAAALIGLALYVVMFVQILRKEGLISYFRPGQAIIPAKEIFKFSIPLLSSQLGFLSRTALVVIILEALRGSDAVAEFRSVIPFARLNLIVLTSFSFLFTPLASRMFSRDEDDAINDLYWTSAIWVMVLTFPALALTCVFAEPLTVFMFGDRYLSSGIILSLMSIGFFFDAALGFTVQTLRVHAKIRYIVMIDVIALLAAFVMFIVLIPAYGAAGAAVGAMATMAFQNIAYFACMNYTTGYGKLKWKYVRTYLYAFALVSLLVLVQYLFHPHIVVAVPLVAIAAIALLVSQREILQTRQFFPELIRVPVIGSLLSSDTVAKPATRR